MAVAEAMLGDQVALQRPHHELLPIDVALCLPAHLGLPVKDIHPGQVGFLKEAGPGPPWQEGHNFGLVGVGA